MQQVQITKWAIAAMTGVVLTVSGCGGGSTDKDTDSYTVTTTVGANGRIAPASAKVDFGDATHFTVTPDNGFQIDSISGCGGSLSGNTYTTGLINTDCMISVTFIQTNTGTTYTINVSAGINGSVIPDSKVVDAGTTASFTLTPDSGYQIASASGCGGNLRGNTFTTDVVNADCTITASFILQSTGTNYTVTAIAGANGSISPSNSIVTAGDSTVFVVTAANGYKIDSVMGCNGSLLGNIYSTSAVNTDCTVSASFVLDSTNVASFSKLDNAGNPLSDQSVDYSATPWACVRDEASGLLWEVKTNDGGLRSSLFSYRWENSPSNPSSGTCQVGHDCTIEGYIDLLNTLTICGQDNWRLPNRGELLSLVDYGKNEPPLIDTSYFPNTAGKAYWSAERSAFRSAGEYRIIDFINGGSRTSHSQNNLGVRLVTGGE